MAHYLLQTAYTKTAWVAMTRSPHNRLDALRPVVQRLGGSVVNAWMSFGDYDFLLICELPDNVSAAALSMAVSSGGAVKAVKTTPLLSMEEGLEALTKVSEAEYEPPPTEFPYFGA